MEQTGTSGTARRDAQSVEIAVAVLAGVASFLFVVMPGAVLGIVLGLHGEGWDGVARLGLLLAALGAVTCTGGVLGRARRRGL